VEVVDLEAQPQEITDQQSMIIGGPHGNIRVFRIDFSAVLRFRDGSEKRVLIELQKAGKLNSIDRFREYLGQHYARPISAQYRTLPLVAIYLCGFWLDRELPTVVRVNRQYLNAYTGKVIRLKDKQGRARRDDFIEMLTHDAVVVQIPSIPTDVVGEDADLQQALQAFNQGFRSADRHYLTCSFDVQESSPAWVHEMLRVLTRAAANEDTRDQMAVEDELVVEWERHDKELETARRAKEAAEQRAHEERRKREIAQQGEIEERRQKEEERRQKEAALAELAHLRALWESKRGDQ
jgi:hypothetical protein